MRYLKILLAYDGSPFAGWQMQLRQPSVQATLQDAFFKVTGEKVCAVASGRTDAGVHALGQVVGIRTQSSLACDALLRALNATLPDEVAVLNVAEAPHDFHAIRDAVRKRYRYVIINCTRRDVFSLRYAWHYRKPLDFRLMQQAAATLIGEHDFRSFQSSGAARVSTVRTVYEISVSSESAWLGEKIVVEVEANGFLYNMVRNIVGTLTRVGQGLEDVSWPTAVLAARDRRKAGPTAPPQGLYLLRVDYDQHV